MSHSFDLQPEFTENGLKYQVDSLALNLRKQRTRYELTLTDQAGVILGTEVLNLADGKDRGRALRAMKVADSTTADVNRILVALNQQIDADWRDREKAIAEERDARSGLSAEDAAAEQAQALAHRLAEIEPAALAILSRPSLLNDMGNVIEASGLVGERANALVIVLAVASQILDKPISLVIKGESSGGKNTLVEHAIAVFPSGCVQQFTAMSERALIYTDEDFAHSTILFAEYSGGGEQHATQDYVIRSLQSEGCIDYMTTVKADGGFTTQRIHKAGPTNFIMTTTKPTLHRENETRLATLLVDDSPAHTRAVNAATAQAAMGKAHETDLTDYHIAFEYLKAKGQAEILVPFADLLEEGLPSVPLRIRRDFPRLLAFIKVSALLHQVQRERDEQGRILASPADYAMVRELAASAFDRGVRDVTEKTLGIVNAVEAILEAKRRKGKIDPTVDYNEIADELDMNKWTISRWIKPAYDHGLLVNLEEAPGENARIQMGPSRLRDGSVLPDPVILADAIGETFEWISPITGEVRLASPTAREEPQLMPETQDEPPSPEPNRGLLQRLFGRRAS